MADRLAHHLTVTISSADTRYCSLGNHIRVYAGSVMPTTCYCGAVKYIKHTCDCGNIHENTVPNKPVFEPLTTAMASEWNAPEENQAWENL